MKNYFYTEQLAERIRDILNRELSGECARNISTGDFSILPEPENLNKYLSAVIIEHTALDISCANEQLDIFYQPHQFAVWYFYPYAFTEFENTPAKAMQYVHEVANVLMNYMTLDDLDISPSETEAGGRVIASQVLRIAYDNAETKLFRMLDLPMFIGRIDYQVDFRTYQG